MAVSWVASAVKTKNVGGAIVSTGILTPTTNVTYSTGGDACDFAGIATTLFGDQPSLVVLENTAGTVFPVYDYANKKIMCYWGAAGAVCTEITASTNIATSILRFVAFWIK